MAGRWDAWDDMPPLVDANMTARTPSNIPPPPGAGMMNGGPPSIPRTAPMSPQYPWDPQFQQYTFPSHPQQDPYAAWQRYYDTSPYQQNSAPSPYIPRQPLNPEMPSYDPTPHFHRNRGMSTPHPATHKNLNPTHRHYEWPTQGDLSPLDLPTAPSGMPDTRMYAPRAPEMNTPSSTMSRTISSSSHIPPGMYHERPQQWRHDFRFKSGFASMFRTRSNPPSVDEFIDSSKLDLHPFLRYSKSRPFTIYDLRREPLTLLFRELNRPPYADDMDHSVTYPPTKYMRIYHSRLPWYIDIRANGAPYISLADFFQQLFAALNSSVSKYDYYNNELDEEDREVLRRIYLERCRSQEERMQGVKRVDFLRGRFEWLGLTPGKNGMWRLKSA